MRSHVAYARQILNDALLERFYEERAFSIFLHLKDIISRLDLFKNGIVVMVTAR
jgi:hypothetical protein